MRIRLVGAESQNIIKGLYISLKAQDQIKLKNPSGFSHPILHKHLASKAYIPCQNMKFQWFTDYCDICFISECETQANLKRADYKMWYHAIFNLSCEFHQLIKQILAIRKLDIFVPASNL